MRAAQGGGPVKDMRGRLKTAADAQIWRTKASCPISVPSPAFLILKGGCSVSPSQIPVGGRGQGVAKDSAPDDRVPEDGP